MIIIGHSSCCVFTSPNLWPGKEKKNKTLVQRWKAIPGRRPGETWSPILPRDACRQLSRFTMALQKRASPGKSPPCTPLQQPAASRPSPLCVVQSWCWKCKCGMLHGPLWLSLWHVEARSAAVSGYDFICVSELGLNSWHRRLLGTYKSSESLGCACSWSQGSPRAAQFAAFSCYLMREAWKKSPFD